MDDRAKRKAPRVKARLKVKFRNAAAFITEYTHNISKGGIFIRTKNPCKLWDKVEVVLVMPEDGQEVSAFGEVIHVVSADQATDSQPAGMGLQLAQIDSKDQELIEEFIKNHLAAGDQDLSYGRREHKRYEARIRVRFGSKEALVEEYIRNISHGGIFICTSEPKPIDEKIMVILTHPDSGEDMLMQGEVVRVVSEEDAKQRPGRKVGMGVKFTEMDEATREQLDLFIKSEHSRNNPAE